MKERDAACSQYGRMSAALYGIMTTVPLPSLPDAHAHWAHARLGRAIEAETWDPQPEGIHRPGLVAAIAGQWIASVFAEKQLDNGVTE